MKNAVLLRKLRSKAGKCRQNFVGVLYEGSPATYHSARLMSLEILCRYVLPIQLTERILSLITLIWT